MGDFNTTRAEIVVFTWRDSSWEEWNLQTELSCSLHPGPSLLHELVWDSALVSKKDEKL